MAIEATTELTYPVREVLAAYRNQDFQKAAAADLGGELVDFSVTGDVAGAFTVTIVRAAPTDRVPEFAKKFVGSSVTFTETDRFSAPAADGSRTVETTIAAKGVPVSVSGTQKLAAQGENTVLDAQMNVASSIPFIGGKITKFAEPQAQKVINRQARFLNSWLASAQS